MIPRPTTATARPYTWNRSKPDETPGVIINSTRGGATFLPWTQVRQLADQLHDLGDRHDKKADKP